MILSEPFIACNECNQLFCLKCFSCGSETKVHKSDHSYTIRKDDFFLFKGSRWIAREEKVFLNLIYSYGVGNWDEISALMNKTPHEVQSHFFKYYFEGILGQRVGLNNNAYVRHFVPHILKTNDLEPPRPEENGYLARSMAGYRFARSDFDVPFDNSAESLFNNLSLNADEDYENDHQMRQIANEVNCAIFRAYNHRLKERNRRYRVIKNHGLLLQRKTLSWLSQYSDIFQNHSSIRRFATFMQISDSTSFDFLMESIKLFIDTKRSLFR